MSSTFTPTDAQRWLYEMMHGLEKNTLGETLEEALIDFNGCHPQDWLRVTNMKAKATSKKDFIRQVRSTYELHKVHAWENKLT